ncbi:MAG: divergent polysaccharide deacetylase family protein [Halioglobus sp.]
MAEESGADCLAAATAAGSASYDKLVIIIDDLGHNLHSGRKALALPGKITYAVIPFTPHGKKLARTAEAVGKEVMVHAPMATQDGAPLGVGGLTADLSREEFRTLLLAAIEEFPQARGINNHMGSDLTERRRQMAWTMQELRWRDLYFVDSRTSENTVAATVAKEFRVPNLSRQVFLDNNPNRADIEARFEELLTKVRERGIAVGIGHPYPETIDYLREALPQLEDQGIRLAFVSEAIDAKAQIAARRLQRNNLHDHPETDREQLADGCGQSEDRVADRALRVHTTGS